MSNINSSNQESKEDISSNNVISYQKKRKIRATKKQNNEINRYEESKIQESKNEEKKEDRLRITNKLKKNIKMPRFFEA